MQAGLSIHLSKRDTQKLRDSKLSSIGLISMSGYHQVNEQEYTIWIITFLIIMDHHCHRWRNDFKLMTKMQAAYRLFMSFPAGYHAAPGKEVSIRLPSRSTGRDRELKIQMQRYQSTSRLQLIIIHNSSHNIAEAPPRHRLAPLVLDFADGVGSIMLLLNTQLRANKYLVVSLLKCSKTLGTT